LAVVFSGENLVLRKRTLPTDFHQGKIKQRVTVKQ
jgi:hypothetical protein